MKVHASTRLAVLLGLFVGVVPSGAQTVHAGTPQLRYGFQADREYPYQIEIHATIADQKIERKGELIYKVMSADADQVVLKTSGSAAGQLGQFGSIAFPRMGPPVFRGRAPEGITLNRRGTVLVSAELTHLPMLLGDLEMLVIDEFPESAQPTWEKQREIVIEETETGGRGGPPFGAPFAPPPVPRMGPAATTRHSAKEVIQFTVAEIQDGHLVRIKKKYSLNSGEKDKIVRFAMSGSGDVEFDRTEGVVRKSSMTYEVKINESNVALTIPITVSSRLFDPSEWAEFKKKRDEAAKAAQEAAAEANRPKPFKPGERDELLEQLTPGDERKQIAAADRLSKAIRDDNPDDFARPLALMLSSRNAWAQASAARALIVWATPEAEDALVDLVKIDNFMYCRPAIEALATLKTEKAALAVASQMTRYRGEAAKALKEMGPVAEAATIPFLKSTDHWIRLDTVNILAEIGGKDSLKILKESVVGLSEYESRDMRRAIIAIQRRLAVAPQDAVPAPRSSAEKSTPRPEKKSSEAAPASGEQEMRLWRDVTGRFEIEASLVSVKGETVTLKKKDGGTIRVSLKKLSPEDRKYIQDQAQAAFGNPEAE